ncbi:MAG: ParA family partition ATPase [Geminicoccaceae bacterium]
MITVAQQKGGAGKTTVAAQLAVEVARRGWTVACVDIDPQATLSAWHGIRQSAVNGANAIDCETIGGWRLDSSLRELARDHDVLIVDSPPQAETEARVAVRAADLVVIPCQPSALDLWASRATLEFVDQERRDARLLLNRVPPRGRLLDQAQSAIDEMKTPLLEARLGNRAAFAQAMQRGLSVVELEPRGKASTELNGLVDEIVAQLF